MPSSGGLTWIDPRSVPIWLIQKSNLGILHGYALFTKIVANLSWNKSLNMTISWKWLEHAQTGPTSHVSLLISDLEKKFSQSPDLQFHEPLFATLYLPIQTELVQAPIDNVVVLL